jgi:hypothetical protein
MTNNDDYLWSGSGEADPEVEQLESALRGLRYEPREVVLPAVEVRRRRWIWWSIPAFAAVAIAIVVLALYVRRPAETSGWDIAWVAGAPRVGRATVGESKNASFGVGQVLETDDRSKASVRAENVGEIQVEPDTRLRLVKVNGALQHVSLERGTIEAFIWAPAGEFVVDTPSATTVDLGCAYTLHVDDSGAGTVRTSMGWVGFRANGREAFIPAGAACSTRRKVGPGTPYFEDASAEFQQALHRFDFEDSEAQQRTADLQIVLREARPHDALTLWHLLMRVDAAQRPDVFEKLSAFAPPPEGVLKEGVLRLDPAMLDAWWNQLGFGDIAIWRHWESNWHNPPR